MTSLELDPRFTFDSYVVGAGNRLAAAAARRVAESPGASYNPLFIYSASGLGKTHLVMALGHHAQRIHPERQVVYSTLEQFMDQVMAAIEAGDRDAFRSSLSDVSVLLLDDVQFLAGRHRTQEELIRAWDTLSARGGQIVLASDRPPPEIDGLDDRLLSRFSGGLIVDIAAPDYETRVAIVRRKADERGQLLARGVAEALARSMFANVRELQGSLTRLIAVQELEGRSVSAEEVAAIVGTVDPLRDPGKGADEFSRFLSDISGTVERFMQQTPAEHHIAEAVMRFESEGYRTRRLENALQSPPPDEEVEALIRQFEADVERLREITGEILSFEPDAPEVARQDVFRDPDRVRDAAELLEEVRERNRPLPAPSSDFRLNTLSLAPDLLAMRAAHAVVDQPATKYNPLYVHGPEDSGKTAFLMALGSELLQRRQDSVVAYLEGNTFAAELIRALERNLIESWRTRYRKAQVLILDNIDALIGTERAQEELFHLFDALQRSGSQLVFASRVAPKQLVGIEERLRTRLEAGLVVELPSKSSPISPAAAAAISGVLTGVEEAGIDEWFKNAEKLPSKWAIEEWLVEETT